MQVEKDGGVCKLDVVSNILVRLFGELKKSVLA